MQALSTSRSWLRIQALSFFFEGGAFSALGWPVVQVYNFLSNRAIYFILDIFFLNGTVRASLLVPLKTNILLTIPLASSFDNNSN